MEDKKELERKKLELKNTIRLYIDVAEQAQKDLNEVNERLKKLETFTPSLSVDAFYYGNKKNTFTLVGSLYSDRFCGMPHELSILTIARAVFTMIDLANWCNAENKSTGKSYELCFDNINKKIDYVCTRISSRSMIKFTSMNSAELALDQINSNPELKRIAMIFLGANDENANL